MHKRSKHIDVHYHFIREKLDENKIKVVYISSDDNIADMFTKALGKTKLSFFSSQLHILNEGEC